MGDSHTCTHGAFGAFAAGIGTTDLEVGILKGVCAFREPKTIRFNLNGTLPKGVYAKDVILHIIGTIGVNGATDRVMEFRGPIVEQMTMESRMTLCNMAIEAGGTSGICMPDMVTVEYLWPFIQTDYATTEAALEDFRTWCSDDDAEYDKIFDFDLSTLEPTVTFGYKPDQVKSIGEIAGEPVDQVYLGSCTNGRLEDLRIAARILQGRKIAPTVRAILSPATPKIYQEAMKEGLIDIFMEAGFCITNPTCGACLGMSNGVLAEGEVCASTTNRNFMGRMGKGGMVHLMSPATSAATAIEGKIADPRKYL
jgi:3-isopropylmalate/(R)-2-methylmalate dehydratase large subunit